MPNEIKTHDPTRLDKVESCPPFLAYALARRIVRGKLKRLTVDELVERSGLPARTFLRIASKASWEQVKFGPMRAFLKACGVDPLYMRKHWEFLRENAEGLPHLTKHQWRILNERCEKAQAP